MFYSVAGCYNREQMGKQLSQHISLHKSTCFIGKVNSLQNFYVPERSECVNLSRNLYLNITVVQDSVYGTIFLYENVNCLKFMLLLYL